jgi:molybdopterin converting factor small subunit
MNICEGTAGNGKIQASSSSSDKAKTSKREEKSNDNKEEITVKDIKDLYRPSFENLQAQANEKINGMINVAIEEYSTKKSNGESISYTYFLRKYSAAGNDLERNTDNAFQIIYSALEKDLKKHGFSPSHANEFKEEYENAKKARESALIEKAKSAL